MFLSPQQEYNTQQRLENSIEEHLLFLSWSVSIAAKTIIKTDTPKKKAKK